MSQNDNSLFLQNFNKAIDNVYEEIKNDKYMNNSQFYNFIIYAMDMICTKMSYQNKTPNKQISVIQEHRMFEIILDFFKSIDVELYNKASKILKNKYPKTKTYIYDFHKDDPNHLTHYCVHYKEGKVEILLPLRYTLSEKVAKEIDIKYGEDFYTIDDLYSITHEISHLFDIKPENYTNEPSKTRDVLTEVTPGIFQLLLSEYLLKNGIFDENIIREKKISINNKLLTHAHLTRMKLNFLELKNLRGKITQEDIESMMENDILSNEEFINILNLIICSNVPVVANKRYAFCIMYAPKIFQKCKMHSNQKLLPKYLDECSQNIPFTDILSSFGIDFKKEIYNYKNENNIER